jgi:hypothetical protein
MEPVQFAYKFYYDINNQLEHGVKTDFFHQTEHILSDKGTPFNEKGQLIANSIVSHVQDAATRKGSCPLHDLLEVIVDMATCIPSGHEWHIVLINALTCLRKRPGHVDGLDNNNNNNKKDSNKSRWSRLGGFSLEQYERDMRLIRISGYSSVYDWFSVTLEAQRKRNLTSFRALNAAREFERDPGSWDHRFDIVDICTGLERDLKPQSSRRPFMHLGMDTDVWVACDWLARDARLIYRRVTSGKALPDNLKDKYALRELCPPGTGLLSIERWEFWKTRIAEILDDTKLGLNGPARSRCRTALAAMRAAELEEGRA